MIQAEKLKKCDEVLQSMYLQETGRSAEKSPIRFKFWCNANRDRLRDVVWSIVLDLEVSAVLDSEVSADD